MLDQTFKARFEKLIGVRITERHKQFPFAIKQIDSQAAAQGIFNSSSRLLQLQRAYEHELDVRSILAWESLVRVHRILGCPRTNTLREDLKTELGHQINEFFSELNLAFVECIQKNKPSMPLSLDEAQRNAIEKHEIEIDLYVDSLPVQPTSQKMLPINQNYNFYGDIGSVQTGANSTANVVQNLGSDEHSSLLEALQQIEEALKIAPTIEEQKRNELIEIAKDCSAQMTSKSPNNTKLLTMFHVLGSAIQSIASAQPAYQALKSAVLPLGITLP